MAYKQLRLLDPTIAPPSRFLDLEEAAGWLGGIIDGEGSVKWHYRLGRPRGPHGHRSPMVARSVVITNTDWDIVLSVQEALEALGIPHRTYLHKTSPLTRKQAWNITIQTRQGLQQLALAVRLQSPTKKATLEAMIATYSTHPKYVNRRPRRT